MFKTLPQTSDEDAKSRILRPEKSMLDRLFVRLSTCKIEKLDVCDERKHAELESEGQYLTKVTVGSHTQSLGLKMRCKRNDTAWRTRTPNGVK